MIEVVVAPELHNNAPVDVVDKVEVPQPFTTLTAGVDGVVFGAETAEPSALVHPSTVLFTVKVPAEVTTIEGVVSPVLHSIVPPAGIDKMEFPQLFATVTVGASGIVFGSAMAAPVALVQPLTVWDTV